MKILYGVQATGNGHISRSREVIKALKSLGHEVLVVFSGREEEKLKAGGISEFEPFRIFQGLTFVTEKGKVQYLKTAASLNFYKFYKDIFLFKREDFDLVVTDFEPVVSRVAKRWKIPCIGVGHQYAFCFDIPKADSNILSWPAFLVTKYFARADISLGLHWYHFNQPILPPIIPKYLKNSEKVIENKILVYLAFEEPREVAKMLEPLTDYDFFLYRSGNELKDEGHLHFRTFSREGFLNDLEECSGVICNAGFELPSEALHLGKKLLVRPLSGQVEQFSNALALEKLKLGQIMINLESECVKAWLDSPLPPRMNYPDVAQAIAEWIGEGKWNKMDSLIEKTWSKIDLKYFE